MLPGRLVRRVWVTLPLYSYGTRLNSIVSMTSPPCQMGINGGDSAKPYCKWVAPDTRIFSLD